MNKKLITNEVKEFCEKCNITVKQFFGEEKIGGNLYLRSLTTLPENCELTEGFKNE